MYMYIYIYIYIDIHTCSYVCCNTLSLHMYIYPLRSSRWMRPWSAPASAAILHKPYHNKNNHNDNNNNNNNIVTIVCNISKVMLVIE